MSESGTKDTMKWDVVSSTEEQRTSSESPEDDNIIIKSTSIPSSSSGDSSDHHDNEDINVNKPSANNIDSKEPTSSSSRAAAVDNNNDNDNVGSLLSNALVDEFICPITLQLPLDPVFAEDSHIYERFAIESYIQQYTNGRIKVLRSPVTNEVMGPKLFPAIQVRNMIEKIINIGGNLITDTSKAEYWIEKIQNNIEVDDMKTKANSGDLDSMFQLGYWYDNGEKGLSIDKSQAFTWYQKAADYGHVNSMAYAGRCLVKGIGCNKNEMEGMCLLSAAASAGSDGAAYAIGRAYKYGCLGLPRNAHRAEMWLTKAVNGSCTIRHMTDEAIDVAKTELLELQQL